MKNSDRVPAVKSTGVSAPGPVRSTHRILVVDHDQDVRQLSVDVLSGGCYDVEAVADGIAGWEALQAKRYDLIITENQMPGMTGVQMIEKLRSAHMALPVIMAARHLPAWEMARKPWLRSVTTLEWPPTNDNLLAAVRKVLGRDACPGGAQVPTAAASAQPEL